MSNRKDGLELRVINNFDSAKKFKEFLNENNKKVNFYFEISTDKSPEKIVTEFQDYNIEKGKNKEFYSVKRDNYSYLVYPEEELYDLKENFVDYLINNPDMK